MRDRVGERRVHAKAAEASSKRAAPVNRDKRPARPIERSPALRHRWQFLLHTRLERVPGRFAGTVTYHDSCAGLREMGIKGQPRALLTKVPGLTVSEMAERETCCGFGGTFAVKYGEISARLADNKCGHIAQCGADAVVLGDLGCMLNIEGRLRRRGDSTTRVLHVAEVLAGVAPGTGDGAR